MNKAVVVALIVCAVQIGAAESAPNPAGCIVERVRGWSAADKAGLEVGDVILEANGQPVADSADLIRLVQSASETLSLQIQRGEARQTLTAKLPPAGKRSYRLGVICGSAAEMAARPQVPPARAPSFAWLLGPSFPVSKLETRPYGSDESTIGSVGFTAGGRLLGGLASTVDLGLEASYTRLGWNRFSMGTAAVAPATALSGGAPRYKAEITSRSAVLLALMKIHGATTRRLSPYGVIGLGAHYSQFIWRAFPGPGLTWLDGTRGGRDVVNDHDVGFASAVGLGLDYALGRDVFIGAEARLEHLGPTRHAAGDAGTQISIRSVSGSQRIVHLLLQLGFKFGKGAR